MQFFQFLGKKVTYLTVSVIGIMALTACGGGDDGGATTTTNTTVIANPTTTIVTPTPTTPNTSTTINTVNTTETDAENMALTLLNEHRKACGFGVLSTNVSLKNTASNHANYLAYISETNKNSYATHYEATDNNVANTGTANPYYTGYDVFARLNTSSQQGSQAITTAYRANSVAENLGLNISSSSQNTGKTDKATNAKNMLQGLLAAPYHMKGLISPKFTEIGVYYKEANWVSNSTLPYVAFGILEMVSAVPSTQDIPKNNQTLHYPCDGVVTDYRLDHEEPNPFGTTRDLSKNPIGQPIYVLAPDDKTITQANATIKTGATSLYLQTLTSSNDPNKRLSANEVIFIPNQPLTANTNYTVNYSLTFNTGETVSKSFNFTTKP